MYVVMYSHDLLLTTNTALCTNHQTSRTNVPDIAASHNMADRRSTDSSRYYQASTHWEFVDVDFHGGQTFVSGQVSFDFSAMLGVAGVVELLGNVETWLTGAHK